MSLFSPSYLFARAWEITPDFCARHGYAGLILDIDNTLTAHGSQSLPAPASDWLRKLQGAGVRLVLLSNNHPPRVEPFANKIGLSFVCDGKKPLPDGYRRAAAALGLPPEKILAVGDQFFTDVAGARAAGLAAALCVPIEKETGKFLRFKRVLERPLWRRAKKRLWPNTVKP